MKIAAGAAGLLLAGAAAAAAVDSPEQATDGLSTAEEHSGVDVPVGADGDHPTGDEDAVETETETEVETEGEGAPEGTHGAEVSAVATSDATEGREHGEAVSEVASDGRVTEAGSAGDDHQADEAELGADNVGEHGEP